MNYQETTKRTVAKAVLWRILLSISHFLNALFVTGSWIAGLQIVGATMIVSSLVYWAHEHVWGQTNFLRDMDEKIKFHDKFSRSGVKLFSWRIAITITNFLIVYAISGSVQTGIEFMSIATVINILIYWFHERLWNRITWGKLIKHDLE
jgi:uncharacterized membrane protein